MTALYSKDAQVVRCYRKETCGPYSDTIMIF